MCLLSFLAAFAPAAQADESEVRVQVEQERSDEDSMSVMEYAWYGLGDGLGVGLAAGYLATGSEFTSDEWDTLALGAGIGALGGMGLGLVLGVADVGQDGPGIGAAALQNISYGLGLGGVAGLIVGGIVAIDSSDTKDVLIGGSIGAVSGAGVGLIVGLIQGAAGDEVEADDDLDDDGFALVDLTSVSPFFGRSSLVLRVSGRFVLFERGFTLPSSPKTPRNTQPCAITAPKKGETLV